MVFNLVSSLVLGHLEGIFFWLFYHLEIFHVVLLFPVVSEYFILFICSNPVLTCKMKSVKLACIFFIEPLPRSCCPIPAKTHLVVSSMFIIFDMIVWRLSSVLFWGWFKLCAVLFWGWFKLCAVFFSQYHQIFVNMMIIVAGWLCRTTLSELVVSLGIC